MRCQRQRLVSVLTAVCITALSACSTVEIATTARRKPVVDLKNHSFTRLAVLPFGGESGTAVSAMMQGALAEWGYYELVERGSLQAIIDELGLQHQGLFATDSAARVGEMLGASHVLLGDVISYSAHVGSETRYRTVKVRTGTRYVVLRKPDGPTYRIPVPVYEDRREPYTYYTVNAHVGVSLRVARVSTAGIAYSKNVSRSFSEGSGNRSALPSPSGVLSELAQAVCNEFRAKICPHTVPVTKTFLKADSDVSESEDEVDRGLGLIRADDLKGAEKALRKATELDSEHAAAWYDLAMVLALRARTREARRLALKAVRLDPQNETIVEGKRWIESLPR